MKKTLLIILSIVYCISCKEDQNLSNKESKSLSEIDIARDDAQLIAQKNGIEHWDKINQLDFTFNVDRRGKTVAQRSWIWHPKTDQVTMILKGDTTTYNRKTIDSTALIADKGFINDKFWLLAPYQLIWDQGTTITVQDSAVAPISGKASKKLTIQYNKEGGYTPGDAYDFFYQKDDYLIDEWVFRKSNMKSPTMTTTFEGYEDHNGLNIATSHKDGDGNFHLYFTGVKVQ